MNQEIDQSKKAEKDRLETWGWNDYFAAQFSNYAADGFHPGRVTLEYNRFYRVVTAAGEALAEIAGKLKHEAQSRADLPAVGDWVALRSSGEEGKAVIHAVLPRRSKFARKMKGSKTEEQIVGANIDTIFLVTSLNQDFNPRRVERYLAIAWESGASPVVVLTKTDLCPGFEEKIAEMQESSHGVPVHPVCAVKGEGLTELEQYFEPGKTVALVGSSGVGKSTLINRMLGVERQLIKDVREHDERGQHATRHRELILLPHGGLVLDTPGMRELQLWDADQGVEATFDDVEELAAQCYFADCRHQTEPKCAVLGAIADGTLARERFDNYLKLQQELNYLARRQDGLAQRTERNKWKKLTKEAEERAKSKRQG